MSHNINSITDIKLQQLWDVAVAMNGAAVTIFCLQETKIPTLIAPTGYTVLHSVWKAWQSGGIATLVPQALAILQSTTLDFFVHVQVAAGCNVVHILNCYLPPSCSCTDSEAWAAILTHLDSIPTTEPVN